VLYDGRPEWLHLRPDECVVHAIRSTAHSLAHLEEVQLASLESAIAQYGFAPDTCNAFARRIRNSGNPHDMKLSEWLRAFVEGTRLQRIPLPDGVSFGQRVPINGSTDAARQIWLPPSSSEEDVKDKLYKQLLDGWLDGDRNDPNNSDCILVFHGTDHSSALRIATSGIQPKDGAPYKDFSHGRDARQMPRVPNRGGFYVSRYFPAAIRWALGHFEEAPAVVIYAIRPRAFTVPPVRSHDFFGGSEELWQATLRYFRGGCRTSMAHELREVPPETADGLGDVNALHCLIGPRSDESLPDGRWRGWRQRAPYTGSALHDAFVRQPGANDNNEQICIKAPFDSATGRYDMTLAKRVDKCLLLVVYL
jgi:hypothetical protein